MRTQNDIIIADLRSNCSYKGISTGHYIPVAKMYQKIFDTNDVYIAGGPVYNKYFPKEQLIQLPNNVSGDNLWHKLLLFWNSIWLFHYAKGKTIIIQQASDVSVHLAIALFYWHKSRLFLIRYSNAGIDSCIKRLIYSVCKHKIDGVICPNDEVGIAFQRPYITVPDYIYIEQQVKDFQVQKKYDFCIVGRIVKEKGVFEVAEWAVKNNINLIIAGKTQTDEESDLLTKICNKSANIKLKLGYISDDEYNEILQSSRYTLLNYQGEYSKRSSGVVYDTLFAGVPVIGKRCKALQFIETHNVGILYDSLDDIDDHILNKILREETRNMYCHSINDYRQIHQSYKNQLKSFIRI